MKAKLLLFIIISIINISLAFSQAIDDFRSHQTGSWSDLNSWDRYDGAEWINPAPSLPSATSNVTVKEAHIITVNQPVDIATISLLGTIDAAGPAGTNPITVTGNFTSNGDFNFGVAVNTHEVTIGGNLIITAGTFAIFDYALTVTGITTISDGLFIDNADSSINVFNGLVTVTGTGAFNTTTVTTKGNVIFQNGITNSGSGDIQLGKSNFDLNTQNITLSSTGNISFSEYVNINANTTIIAEGTGTCTFNDTIKIANNTICTNLRTVVINGLLNGATGTARWINENGSYLNYNNNSIPMATGIFDVSTAINTVEYNGTSSQIMKDVTYYNLIIDNAGPECRLNGDATVNGDITVNSGKFDVHNYTLTLKGNYTNLGTLECSKLHAKIVMNGTTKQTFTVGTYFHGFISNFEINNPNNVELGSSLTINDAFTLTDGILITASNKFIFNKHATVEGTPSNSSFVNGAITKVGKILFNFPVGIDSGDVHVFAPLLMAAPNLVQDTFTVEYHVGEPPYPYTDEEDLNNLHNILNKEWWSITRGVTSTSTPAITLYWKPENINHHISNNADLRIAHYNTTTSKWDNMGGSGVGTVGLGYEAEGSITSTIPFTKYNVLSFGSETGSNPLPLDLIYFDTKCDNNKVVVMWTTASEYKNDFFTIQKSYNAIDWTVIGQVKGAGSSNLILNYIFTDVKPADDLTYYRIKLTDYNGNVRCSEIKASKCDNITQSNIAFGPNPCNDILNLEYTNIEGKTTVEVCNLMGTVIKKFEATNIKNNILTINLIDLVSGIYFIKVYTSNYNNKFKIVKD